MATGPQFDEDQRLELSLIFGEVSDVLAGSSRQNHDFIAVCHDNQVADPVHRNPYAVGMDQISVAIVDPDHARQGVAVFILGPDFMQGIPTADVGPPHADRGDGDLVRFFHNGIIDAV